MHHSLKCQKVLNLNEFKNCLFKKFNKFSPSYFFLPTLILSYKRSSKCCKTSTNGVRWSFSFIMCLDSNFSSHNPSYLWSIIWWNSQCYCRMRVMRSNSRQVGRRGLVLYTDNLKWCSIVLTNWIFASSRCLHENPIVFLNPSICGYTCCLLNISNAILYRL